MGRARIGLCVVSLSLTLALPAAAQNHRAHRTVTECAQDLSREVFLQLNYKKAKKYCQDFSQRSIDCATELAQAKKLTYDKFEKALGDCSRVRDPEPPEYDR